MSQTSMLKQQTIMLSCSFQLLILIVTKEVLYCVISFKWCLLWKVVIIDLILIETIILLDQIIIINSLILLMLFSVQNRHHRILLVSIWNICCLINSIIIESLFVQLHWQVVVDNLNCWLIEWITIAVYLYARIIINDFLICNI